MSVSRQSACPSVAETRARRRRAASALVVPIIVGGLLGVHSSAVAGTAVSGGGICNGVTNQLAHRGMVQPNLLKAAARQNADMIAKLQAERDALTSTQKSLATQIAAAEKLIADFDIANAELDGDIAA